MASEPFQDAAILDQMLQQALSPIDTYGRGILSLAIARKNRDQQLQDVAEEERFRTSNTLLANRLAQEREIDQRAWERERIGLTNQARIDLETKLYGMANDQKKQELLDEQKREATANGLKLPANSTYDDYVKANADAAGQKITAAIRTVNNTGQALAAVRGQTREELRRDQMSKALATIPDTVKKRLTAAQINGLINDPTTIGRLMDQAARLNDKNLLQALADINGQVQQATSEMLTKAVNDKTMTQELKDQNDTAQAVLQSLLKNNRYPASAIIDAFKGYGQAALGGPAAAAPPVPQRPPLPTNLVSHPVSQAAPSALVPTTNADMRALQQIPVVTPEAITPTQGPVDPAKLRLRAFLQQQSSNQQALTPTAFPGFIVPPTFKPDNPLLQPQP